MPVLSACHSIFLVPSVDTHGLPLSASFSASTAHLTSSVDSGGAAAVFLIAAGSPPQFPSDLDLSPIIAHIGRHPSWEHWREATIAYLMQCDISSLSDPAGVHRFLHQCVHLELSPEWEPEVEIRRASTDTHDAALILMDRKFSPSFLQAI